jgi:hypothetical protein
MKQITLGSFEVKSGKLMVSDPCYSPDTWCQTVVDNVLNGAWTVVAMLDTIPGWGERVVSLRAFHAASQPSLTDTCEGLRGLGVDSGQMGIFCLDSYQVDGRGEYDDKDSFYGKACSLTSGKRHGGVMPGGCVSSSGFGDGSYSGFIWKDNSGKVKSAQVVFITDDEDEEDFQEEEE